MKRSVTIELDQAVLTAARGLALDQSRSLSNLVEWLLKRELGHITGHEIEVMNAAGISSFTPDREDGESDEEYEQRKATLAALFEGEQQE
jgi:hypothetical protein